MTDQMHDLLHSMVMLEKHHHEVDRWIEIVNKLLNEMILNDNPVDNNASGNYDLGDSRPAPTGRESVDG